MIVSSATSPSLARLADAYHYLYYSDRIDGWMFQTTGLAMMELLWLQEEAGFHGNVAEIGVYHGCSALALIAAARPTETMFAIDLFDRQDLNVDNSGKGDLAAFQEHLRHLFPQAPVRTIANSSLEIRGAEKDHGLTGVRFFSVDGGHTIALTLNDLEVANASLAPHGVAALDDVFNVEWTGVVSGLFAFLAREPDLVPFAVFPNKVFLCRRPFTDLYRKGCRDTLGFALEKSDLEFQDHAVDLYGDRWPTLSARLANPEVAAAAAPRTRKIDESAPPIRRQMIARPGDTAHALSQLEYVKTLLSREQRHCAMLRFDAEKARLEAVEAMRQVAALRSSTSWRITAPLRWLKQRRSGS